MSGKIAALFIVSVIAVISLSVTEVDSADISVGVPGDAITFAVKKVDSWFSCSRYDGYAACFHRGGGKDRRNREAGHCNHANVWDYKHSLGGKCWCFKCT
jgi:hypothetical protein